jgi:hypothetical protein
VLFSGATQFNPTNFEQAWNHNVAKDREKWRMAIEKEFNNIDLKNFGKKSRKKISQKD